MEEVKKAIAILEFMKMSVDTVSDRYKAIDLSIKSLEMQYRMMEHCEGTCSGCNYCGSNEKFTSNECMNDFIIQTN